MHAHRTLARSIAIALTLAFTALAAGCTEEARRPKETPDGGTPSVTQPPAWEGKGDQEAAMKRATRALNAVEPDSAAREDSGTATLADGLDRTFAARGDRPYTFDIACQAAAPHTVVLTLVRGDAESEWEVECGDREADQFNVPAGAPFTAAVAPAKPVVDGLVLWRLNTVALEDVEDCVDDITGCEN
ncbi:hypothetical protein [Streptomyces antibioticus]|uniref:Lipoprotein n=1 Tax=Streptomyces antibioticus TaxID=1890 RepID=A0AAE6YAF6_STRAT|nr:hypothetical protein [Streptomyces antibioticus]OOQ51097.1 hypothetical protein AFM16_17980 [Streptomyces antibioticus]QIT45254.1 hypothetical protein HCX60_18250 [Streptomyces antibioticus]